MKTISDYTIPCTPEQTKKAFELGAPINKRYTNYDSFFECFLDNPTAEQMIGYLEEKHSLQFLTGVDDEDKFFFNVYHTEGYIESRGCNSRKEATLAAIDAALEYLINKKK